MERLNARTCERCGSTDKPCEVHHLKRLADVRGRDALTVMRAARTRKRIVLCVHCHEDAHRHRPYTRRPKKHAQVESRMR